MARSDLLLVEETGGSSADPKLGKISGDGDEDEEYGDEEDDDFDEPAAPRQQPQQRVLSLQEAYEVMVSLQALKTVDLLTVTEPCATSSCCSTWPGRKAAPNRMLV